MTRYMTTASISAALLDAHSSFIKLIPPKRKAALTTPIKAPPAIKPEASNVPFSKRAEFKLWSLLRLPTYQLIAPPIKSGVFRSKGKKEFDKRESLKLKDAKKDMERAMKR